MLRATRERAILAVRSTASAMTGHASASPAGRGSTVTLVSACGSAIIPCDILIRMCNKVEKMCYNCILMTVCHLFP